MTLPYRDYSEYLHRKFGCKVYKISLNQNFTCPNRDGTLGTSGCIYCGEDGAFDPYREPVPMEMQIKEGKEVMRRKYKAEKFIAYFQAFTNTYGPPGTLEGNLSTVSADGEFVGISIGTRPDCVGEEILDLIERNIRGMEIWLELGLQSANNETLLRIKRGHNAECFTDAVRRCRARGFKVCAHVILGLPGETKKEMMETAEYLAGIGIDGVKIHSAHIVRNTELERLYNSGAFIPPEMHEYVDWAISFLEILPPSVVVQRLTGERGREFLVAPKWCVNKHVVRKAIVDEMVRRNTKQGLKFCPVPGPSA